MLENSPVETEVVTDAVIKEQALELVIAMQGFYAEKRRRLSGAYISTPSRSYRYDDANHRGVTTLTTQIWDEKNVVYLFGPHNDRSLGMIDYTPRTYRRLCDPYHHYATYVVGLPQHDIVAAGHGVFIIPEEELAFSDSPRVGSVRINQYGGYFAECRRTGDFAGGLEVRYTGGQRSDEPIDVTSLWYSPVQDDETFEDDYKGIHTQADRIAWGRRFIAQAREAMNINFPARS